MEDGRSSGWRMGEDLKQNRKEMRIEQERSRLMALARKRRFQERRQRGEYRSTYLAVLPPPSDRLLSQSLARIAREAVHRDDYKNHILNAVNTIQCLLDKYPSMQGSFTKSLCRLRTAIRMLPQEDVDPHYYSFLEETVIENYEYLNARVVSALAWARDVEKKKHETPQGTANVKVIAVPNESFLSILINDHKRDVQSFYQGCLKMRDKLQMAGRQVNEARLPEPMKTSIRKSFEQVIHCFSLEASVPYKMMDDIEGFVGLLEKPYPLDGEMLTKAKLLKVKAENCLIDSKRENNTRLVALAHIAKSCRNLDEILSCSNRPYWMMDMPDVNEQMGRTLTTDLAAYIDFLKKELALDPPEKVMGCLCYRQTSSEADGSKGRTVPLCPKLLSYTEELRERWEIPKFPEEGSCHCSWLRSNRDQNTTEGKEQVEMNFRLYAKHINNTAKARDFAVDVSTCSCPWNKIRRAFGGSKQRVCFSFPGKTPIPEEVD